MDTFFLGGGGGGGVGGGHHSFIFKVSVQNCTIFGGLLKFFKY